MTSRIDEMARDLGQALGRTEEYQALRRAATGIEEDQELVRLKNELDTLESEVLTLLRSGQEPDQVTSDRYETLAESLQVRPAYQRLVVSQANFDKILQRVNDTIAKGIQDAGTSRIILPS